MAGKQEKFIYECIQCGRSPGGRDKVHYLCPHCSPGSSPGLPPQGLLKVLYDYQGLREKHPRFSSLKSQGFLDLLPINSLSSLPPLRTGHTPLIAHDRLRGKKLHYTYYLKDDSQNPTFSFKDRASALVSAFAYEQGLEPLVVASTGNAGSSLAGMCAARGQRAVIMVPETAPPAKISQVLMYGARLFPVRGNYDQAFELSLMATESFGWYNRNTAYNPLTFEGKKTAAYELFDQLKGQTIHRVFVPTGDGVILSGICKGFEELLKLGYIDQMPCMVAIQSGQSDNLVRNLDRAAFASKPSTTLADSISVDVPRGFYMARDFLHRYEGEGMTISDDDIRNGAAELARTTGLFAEPAAAAAYAGLLKYHEMGKLEAGSNNIVLLTGSGLKDLAFAGKTLTVPPAIEPGSNGLKALEAIMANNT